MIYFDNGFKSIVRPMPDNDAGEIGIWTRNMDFYDTAFVRSFLTKGDFIVDAGCNVGNRTLALADLVAGALLIDAGQQAVDRARENLRLNNLAEDKFIVVNKAVGVVPGMIRFTDFGGASTQNKVVEEIIPGKVVEVEMTTIDHLVEEYGMVPAFIKTDVEGQDLNALKGAVKTLKSGVVKLVKFEHTSDVPLEPIVAFFDYLNWIVFGLDEKGKPSIDNLYKKDELNLFAMPKSDYIARFGKV